MRTWNLSMISKKNTKKIPEETRTNENWNKLVSRPPHKFSIICLESFSSSKPFKKTWIWLLDMIIPLHKRPFHLHPCVSKHFTVGESEIFEVHHVTWLFSFSVYFRRILKYATQSDSHFDVPTFTRIFTAEIQGKQFSIRLHIKKYQLDWNLFCKWNFFNLFQLSFSKFSLF